jgi:hypothetical protein
MIHKPHYCYQVNGVSVILTRKPDNFSKLPYHYKTHCPNKEVAARVYKAYIKIAKLREP